MRSRVIHIPDVIGDGLSLMPEPLSLPLSEPEKPRHINVSRQYEKRFGIVALAGWGMVNPGFDRHT
jgi:hypothetical protein